MLESADEVDSKSIASDGVRVQVPPPAPGRERPVARKAFVEIQKLFHLSFSEKIYFPIQTHLSLEKRYLKGCLLYKI